MAKKIPFPIKTKTSCLLKWNWSSLFLRGASSNSCHRNWKAPLSLEDFDNFHNLPYKIAHRKSMLRGEWPDSPDHLGCYYCKEIEDTGGRSDRQFMTEVITDQTPDELEHDPQAVYVTPAVLEVFVNHVCNLGCTYCNMRDSSVIEADAKKFNNPEFDNLYFNDPSNTIIDDELLQKYFQKLLKWFEKNGSSLRRFHILGGEPFFQKELDDILDTLYQNPNPTLQLCITSNMNVNHNRLTYYFEKIQKLVHDKKIERFDLTASVDCWGTSQEYVRRGFKMEKFEKNLLYALHNTNFRINFNSTHSLMSLDDYPLLLKKKKYWEDVSSRQIASYNMTVNSLHVDPRTLGGEFFKETLARIRKNHPIDNWDDRQAYKNINGILTNIENSKPSLEMMKHFVTVYNELDRRHGTDWRLVFPRIADEIDKNIIL